MMARILILCIPFALVTAGAAAPPQPAPPAPALEMVNYSFGGPVEAVDAESVTIRGFDVTIGSRGGPAIKYESSRDGKVFTVTGPQLGFFDDGGPLSNTNARRMAIIRTEYTQDRITVTPADGEPFVLRREDQKPRRFVALGPLAEGKYAKSLNHNETYRLGEVRVGDRVDIRGRRVGMVEYVETISITRRPGGQVPPAPGEVDDLWRQQYKELHPEEFKKFTWHHDRMNAMQAWEEHGHPIPDLYHPGGSQTAFAPAPRPVGTPPPADAFSSPKRFSDGSFGLPTAPTPYGQPEPPPYPKD